LFASFLDLNDAQTGLIYSAFKIADDQGMLMLDLKDLKSMLSWMKANRKQLEDEYGGISPASVAAILRKLFLITHPNCFKIKSNKL